jgi:ABC-type transport system involved in multi-copper enzyme maturation permease subunit
VSGALARIGRLIAVETTKLTGGRLAWLGMLVVAVATVATGLLPERLPPITGWTVAARALGSGLWVAEILVVVVSSTAIAGESDRGTLKMILPHAYRRSDWIVAKAVVLVGLSLALLVVATLGALACGAATLGLGDVVQTFDPGFSTEARTELLYAAGTMASHVASAVAVAAASLVATSLLGLLVSCAFDAVIPALSVGFLLFMAMKSAETVFTLSPDVVAQIYAGYPPDLLSAIDKMGRWIGKSWPADHVGKGLELSGIVAAVALAGSLAVFTRRDLRS